MRLVKIIIILLGFWLPSTSLSEDNVVIELFTSQGCSSCPPADAILQELEKEDAVIVLGWHVDYWDYLGWKDLFSSAENTKRQIGYRDRWQLRSLYTPQIVVQGNAQVIGSDEQKIREYVDEYRERYPKIAIHSAKAGLEQRLKVSPLVTGMPDSEIFLIQLIPLATTAIARGENAGRSLDYVNIVREVVLLSEWNGQTTIDFDVTLETEDRYVILVQAANSGPILGAKYIH